MAGIAVSRFWFALALGACGGQPSLPVEPGASSGVAVSTASSTVATSTPASTTASSASTPASALSTASPTQTVASAPPATATATATALVPASASFEDPSFDGGDVAKAKASIEKLKKGVEKCINAEGGVSKDGATIKIQFLVRTQGIAEGADIVDAKGIGDTARKCVRDAFKKKKIGPPSADPVGVTVVIDFRTKDPA